MFTSRSQFWQPFLLSLLAVSAFSSKALHLFQHVHSVARYNLLLYLPTFFIQDALLCIAIWFLLHKTSGAKSVAAAVFSGILACITLSAASSQIGFYFVTGSEIRWNTAKSVSNDPEGRKLIFSGLKPVLEAWTFLVVVAWFLTPTLYVLISRWSSAFFGRVELEEQNVQLPGTDAKRRIRANGPARIWTICLAIGALGLWTIRPSVPYDHMSTTLPIVILQVFVPQSASSQFDTKPFPFPELLEPKYWESPYGHFPGWSPNTTVNTGPGPYFRTRPSWASCQLPPGFGRWAESSSLYTNVSESDSNTTNSFYNPVTDPLKITNMDSGVLDPLDKTLKDHDIPITHVVLILMESARKDVFPFKAGSALHEKILASHDTTDPELVRKVNEKLSHLTPIAEYLTGQSSGFAADDANGLSEMGGLNVDGVSTGSSLSFKSAVMNYCGVQPLPVNFMEEAESEIYQPCIMQILELFNRMKGELGLEAVHDRKWKSIFLQSITGRYDKQSVLNERMGFNESIYKETLIDKASKYYHVPMERINYFGYPEQEVYPYIRDAINDAVENKTRLFLSHFTSTTHHPWGTPNAFEYVDYFSTDGASNNHHVDINSYLNAVRYVDDWLGDVLKLLDDSGIANETLVVLVGDHGQAFDEDAPVSGTYQNSHISNFNIPLVFHHPLLPRVQVRANTTSMSLVPTILDLLVQTRSLNKQDTDIASDLMNEYEGQSLIRPFKRTHNGRQAWNFSLINPGGELLSVGSAAVPYRLILPITDNFEYKFINQEIDLEEKHTIGEWEAEMLAEHVRSVHGEDAATWVGEAVLVGRWWIGERKRLWDYHRS